MALHKFAAYKAGALSIHIANTFIKMGTIRIERGSELINLARKYDIYIDNLKVGKISHGKTKEFELGVGNHTIYTKIDGSNSPTRSFILNQFETKIFKVSAFKNSNWITLLYTSIVILYFILKENIHFSYLIYLALPVLSVMFYFPSFRRKNYLILTKQLKQPLSSFREIVLNSNRLMVHTLYPNYLKGKGTLIERIQHTIDNAGIHEVCTCTVTKGDSQYNYYQDIGIILKDGTVTFCANGDAGSSRTNGDLDWNWEIVEGIEDPTPEQIQNAIDGRARYNEFRITNYTPIGIFLSSPPYGINNLYNPNNMTNAEFHAATEHLGLDYYFLQKGQLYILKFVDTEFEVGRHITYKELYA